MLFEFLLNLIHEKLKKKKKKIGLHSRIDAQNSECRENKNVKRLREKKIMDFFF